VWIAVSSIAISTKRPRPVRSRSKSAVITPAYMCVPERKSIQVGPAFTGGPSGKPVTLIAPEAACTVKSSAR
jgi:hypothetical protein